MANKKIVMCIVQENRYHNAISVKYSDGTEDKRLGVYFPNDVHFSGMELMNLTRHEAIDLIKHKGMICLKS